MRVTAISVTDAARNFADCVNRAHYQNITFVLLRNGSPVARLVPDGEKVCTGRDLAEIVATARPTAGELKAWGRDLHNSRKALKPPVERWR